MEPTKDSPRARVAALMARVAVGLAALSCVFWCGYQMGRSDVEREIAKRYYRSCRETLGLEETMTALPNGQSACAQLITEDLGIENRWTGELR